MAVATIISGMDEQNAPLLYTDTMLAVGEVIAVVGDMLSARLPYSNTIISQVYLSEGTQYQAGDRVLLAKVHGESRWIAITKVLSTAETGGGGFTLDETVLHPPSNLNAAGYAGIVVVQWDCWTGNTVAFEVQSNVTQSETGAQRLYTRGSVYVRECASGSIHVRVRSLQYNVAENVAYYSGWTAWSSASSTQAATTADIAELRSIILAWMWHQEEKWLFHRMGVTE